VFTDLSIPKNSLSAGELFYYLQHYHNLHPRTTTKVQFFQKAQQTIEESKQKMLTTKQVIKNYTRKKISDGIIND
jgi:hypothetical protein